MGNYFRGLYYRCQSDTQTLAIIPSFHITKAGVSANIQIITDNAAYSASFSCQELPNTDQPFSIGDSRFGDTGISLNVRTEKLHASGELRFGPFTPIAYDIMGPFRLIPFLQCSHSVFSMKHCVKGELTVNGIRYPFDNADGYLEGDRGRSFPKAYAWTQCFFPEGSLMLSVADVPFGPLHITGVIGILLIREKEYRFATYLGAKAVKIENGAVTICQGRQVFTAKRLDNPGHPLHAPVGGAMGKLIYENPSCRAYYRFEDNGVTLLELEAENAAFEFEY